MKINFMKMNALKISKKINFRTCASVLVIQVAVFGFQGFAEAGKEDGLRAHFMAQGFDERVVRAVVVQGGATSGEDLFNKLKAAQALLPLLPPQEPLGENRIRQVAALPEEDRVEGANLVAAQVEPTPDNIREIRNVLDPNHKQAAAWMIGQGHPRDQARIEAVRRMFEAGCDKDNVTAPRIGAVANEADADRKAAIAHLAFLNQDAAFGGNENGNAVLAMRNAGANFDRITAVRIANWIGEGDANRKAVIAHLAALNQDANFGVNENGAAVLAMRNAGAGFDHITAGRIANWIGEGDANRKVVIAHLTALNIDSDADHIAAVTALRTDHAGHPIDWVRITNAHVNAYVAGADAARKAEIVHLAALNLPAHGNNIAAMTALRTNHAGNEIAWNRITAEHVNAYVGGIDADHKAGIVHLAALHLPANADHIAAITALRRDHAGNDIAWDHITHGRVENYIHDANPQQRAAIIHLTSLNENADFGVNKNGGAVLAMRNAGAEYAQITAERIAVWVNQIVAPGDRPALSHVILTDVTKDNDHIDAAKKLIEATVENITGGHINAVAAEIPEERLAAAIIIKSGISVKGDSIKKAKDAIAASQRAGASAPQAAQDLLDLHGVGEARLTVGNMIYLYNHHDDRAGVLADMRALQNGATDGHPREISALNLDALRARRDTEDYLTYINALPVV